MRINFRNIAIATAILIAPIATKAQDFRANAPLPGPAPIIELGESTVTELSNGLTVIVVENHRLPEVTWSLSFNHSPYFEGDKAGMLDLFGQILTAGTTDKTKAELDEEIDFLGASLSGSSKSIYANSLTKHSETILALMTDVLYNPSFPEEELNKSKTQVLSGLVAAETSPNDISDNLTRSLLYGSDHPYGSVVTASTIDAITRQDLVDYHSKYFVPNAAYLVVVGDITPETALETAQNHFGNWKAGEVENKNWDKPTLPKGIRVCLAPLDGAVQSSLKLTHVVDLKPGHEDAIAVSVMNSILGGGIFSGRLMQNLREDKAFTYGARSSISNDELIGKFTAYADVRNEVTDSAVVEFLYEIRRMTVELVDDESLSITKNSMTGSFARNLESPNAVARFAYNIEKYDLPEDYYATYLERLNSVTKEDVMRVAKKYLKADQIYITCVGSRDVMEGLRQFSTSGVVELFDPYGQPLVERRAAAKGVSVETVINDYYNARGGAKKFSKIKTIEKVGSVEIGGAMTLGYNSKTSYKGKLGSVTSFSMSGMEVMSSVVTPEKGVISQMGPKQPIEGNDLIAQQWESLSPAHLLNSEDYGIKSTLLGIENINGTDYHAISFEHSSGEFSSTCFFDMNTKLLSMKKEVAVKGEEVMTSTTTYDKYGDAGKGLLFPFELVTQAGPQTISIRLSSVNLGADVNTDLFNLD